MLQEGELRWGKALDFAGHVRHEEGPQEKVRQKPPFRRVVRDQVGGELPYLSKVVEDGSGEEEWLVEEWPVVAGNQVGQEGDREGVLQG